MYHNIHVDICVRGCDKPWCHHQCNSCCGCAYTLLCYADTLLLQLCHYSYVHISRCCSAAPARWLPPSRPASTKPLLHATARCRAPRAVCCCCCCWPAGSMLLCVHEAASASCGWLPIMPLLLPPWLCYVAFTGFLCCCCWCCCCYCSAAMVLLLCCATAVLLLQLYVHTHVLRLTCCGTAL
jgi:hypothetical protein